MKKLLLHVCCAPCATYVIELLKNEYEIALYFYNPNIFPEEEYNARAEELIRFVKEMHPKIDVIVQEYDHNIFLQITKEFKKEPERGKRCTICYNLRLEETAKKAKEMSFDVFTSTLSISPYKNANIINGLGEGLSKKYKLEYLISDFKKNDGYKKSIELSKKYNLYRQNYCGCEFSK